VLSLRMSFCLPPALTRLIFHRLVTLKLVHVAYQDGSFHTVTGSRSPSKYMRLGTLLLDLTILNQPFLYGKAKLTGGEV
jgi:hypothetical protein